MCWMSGSCSGALVTMWCTLWLRFHQPSERPPSRSATRMPSVESVWKPCVMPMWPASCAVKTSWCQKRPSASADSEYCPQQQHERGGEEERVAQDLGEVGRVGALVQPRGADARVQ